MEQQVRKIQNDKDANVYGATYDEVTSTTPWNFGLIETPDNKLDASYKVEKLGTVSNYPWNLANAPIQIHAKAKRIPSWQLYNDMTGPIPFSVTYELETSKTEEDIVLVPYGCTILRISQFPVVEGNR
jgi:hypothetical protein